MSRNIKTSLISVFFSFCLLNCLASCGDSSSVTSSSDGGTSSSLVSEDSSFVSGDDNGYSEDSTEVHYHTLVHHEAKEATCTQEGTVEYWYCTGCNKYYGDSEGSIEIDTVVSPAAGHNLVRYESVSETEEADGNYEYYHCTRCGQYYADDEAEVPLTQEETIRHNYDEAGTCSNCSHEFGGTQGLDLQLYNDGTYYICYGRGDSTDTDIVIPFQYNGLPVKEVSVSAFKDDETITSVKFGRNIEVISGYSFYNCTNLQKAVFDCPEAELTSPFKYCTSLQNPVLNVRSIQVESFSGCTSVTKCIIGENVSSIATNGLTGMYSNRAFVVREGNTSYKSVDGDVYRYDGEYMLQYAIGKEDESFTIPEGVIRTGAFAFYEAQNLKEVRISDTVEELGMWSHQRCPALERVYIGKGVSYIDTRAFGLCYNLVEFIVDEENTYVVAIDGDLYTNNGNRIIQYCFGKNPVNVELADNLIRIGGYSFWGCKTLESIVVGTAVTQAEPGAFSECDNLKTVYYKGDEDAFNDIVDGGGNDAFFNADRYYYSEEKPTDEGNYWRYVDGVPTPW